MKDSGGFATILLISILPFLLASLFAILFLLTTTQLLTTTRLICRVDHLKIQKVSSETLSVLEKINIKIKLLRAELTSAQLALAAAIASENPAAVVAAKIWIKKIKTNQNLIAQEQKIIFFDHRLKMQAMSLKLKRNLQNEMMSLAKKLRFFARIEIIKIESPPGILAVRPDYPSLIPPVYEPEDDFNKKQSSSAFWSWRLSVQKTQWLHNWLNSTVQWKDACGATLKMEGQQWEPQLLEVMPRDRSWLKPSAS